MESHQNEHVRYEPARRDEQRLHVIVPFDYTEQMRSWLRLTIAAFYNSCLRNRLPEKLPRYLQFRHIVIDELPASENSISS